MIGRIKEKARQIRSFYQQTETPLDLALEVMWLKRRPFVAATRGGLKLGLRPGAGEGFTFYENLIRRDYLTGGMTLKPGDTVVDVGANIGAFSILAASMVGPSGRVFAFDPMPGTYERLVENVGLNGLENVSCRCAAVDAEDGTLTLRSSTKNAYSSAYLLDGEGAEATTSPCWSIERVFRECDIDRINFFKVDCEGSEYGIFDALSPELAARIDQIAMEVHPVQGRSSADLRRRLEDLGFEVSVGYPWTAVRRDRPA